MVLTWTKQKKILCVKKPKSSIFCGRPNTKRIFMINLCMICLTLLNLANQRWLVVKDWIVVFIAWVKIIEDKINLKSTLPLTFWAETFDILSNYLSSFSQSTVKQTVFHLYNMIPCTTYHLIHEVCKVNFS